jgi:hypothetical protein
VSGADTTEIGADGPSETDGAVGADVPSEPPEGAGARRWRVGTPGVVAGLTAVVTLPLVVALGALHSPRWYPLLDLAMTELRVRDVGTRHTPLTGLVGRLSSNGNQGSHPGPISFWALAPVYRVLGGSAWSLFVGVVVMNATAIALTIWIALRRGGARLALGVAAGLALLVNLYGTQVLTEPWNPYMPVMWWPLTLVAVWAVLCDDLAMLPVAVFAASFCMQTHISYLGLVGGLMAIAAVGLAVRAVMLRGEGPALRRLGFWTAISVVLGVVLWLPTLVDQVTGDPGNMSIVYDYFRQSDESPIGLGRGAELLGAQLNLWRLAAGQPTVTGTVVPGVALLVAWVAAVAAAWRLPADGDREAPVADAGSGAATALGRRATLLRLHAVVAAALVLGLVSASRILGHIWYYLTLWSWATTMVMTVAVVWTAATVVSAARPAWRPLSGRAVPVALAAVLLAWTAMFTVDALDAEPTQHRVSETLGDITVPVLDAIEDGDLVAEGRDARLLVTWTDGTYIGAPGYGLLSELERRGLDVGAPPQYADGVIDHRVTEVEDADARVHLSVGPDIPEWQDRPDAEMVVLVDPRTDAERARYERARTASIAELERLGRTELLPMVDHAPFMLFLDYSLPEETREVIAPLGDIGQPIAVFIAPPDVL